ncbi:MAG: hypothetical protein KBE65_03440 [Phycisphaerae bacterium]|nr:hypothetical protein [Phycisphaerae bacterium]
MQTVFSHIIQKRFSQVNEDVATDALAYILESSESACNGMMKLLRGIVPDLPPLRFKTQQTEGAIRPDMWGCADNGPRVFVENKFWAGLTDSQPVSYLKQLAAYTQPTVLLVIAPAAREQTLWRDLRQRLLAAGIFTSDRPSAAGIPASLDTQLRSVLAITSWTSVLSMLEHECVDDPTSRGDLVQLRALCDAADSNAFSPISRDELTNQRLPAFMLELSSVLQDAVDRAVAKQILNLKGTMPQASSERIGRYSYFERNDAVENRPGAWIGIHFRLWRKHGGTPFWVVFHDSDWGQAHAARRAIEPWASREGVLSTTDEDGSFVVALDVPAQEEKSCVVDAIVARLHGMSRALAGQATPGQSGDSDA